MKNHFWIFQLHEKTFKFFKFVKNVFKFFNFKKNTFINHVKDIFEAKLSKSNFTSNEIHLISNMKLFDHCQGHVNECLVHWNGLLGDVRATDSWCTGPRWISTGHSMQDGICCVHPINIWRMVWLWTQSPYPAMSHTILRFW